MKHGLTFACIACLLASTTTALADGGDDAAKHGEDLHVGLGAALTAGGFTVIGNNVVSTPFGGASILVPIDIGGVVRIEPEVGYVHLSQTDTQQGSGASDTESTSSVRVGVGAFFWFHPASDIGAYVGGRLGPAFAFTKDTVDDGQGNTLTNSGSRVDFNIGPAFGAEYYFSPNFAMGAEAQVNFTILGNESVSVDPDPGVPVDNTDESGLISSTNAMLTMRVFLL